MAGYISVTLTTSSEILPIQTPEGFFWLLHANNDEIQPRGFLRRLNFPG
jgi:hypothetical protein